MIYPLVKEMAAVGARVRVPVAVACRILGFSKQGYYKWLKQPVSAREAEEQELISVLHQLHNDDPEGGYRVLADDLAELGYELSERRVWRLCRVAGIQSVFARRRTRYKKAGAPVHDDLVNRQFSADGPNQVWLTDITEHRTREGKVYLCAIKDVFSNRIVGYSIDSRMKARIAVNALEMAVAHRGRPAGVIVHSDRGSQFRSRRFRKALKRHRHVARWAGSGHVAITPRWSRSSRYCRRTSSTVDPGAHERNCAWPSCPGSRASTTANAVNADSGNSPPSSSSSS